MQDIDSPCFTKMLSLHASDVYDGFSDGYGGQALEIMCFMMLHCVKMLKQ